MNTKYDKSADAVYIKLKSGKVAKTLRLENQLIVDLDKKSNILGLEILNASSQISAPFIKKGLKISNSKALSFA